MVDPTSVEPTDTLQRNSYFREKFDILDLMRKEISFHPEDLICGLDNVIPRMIKKLYSKTINPNASLLRYARKWLFKLIVE